MASKRIKDMTTGPVGRTMILFTIPILLSSLLQHAYNLVDTVIAGYLYGDHALAAIGASSSIYSLLIGLASGMNGGFELVLARAFGSHDEKKFKSAIAAALVLNLCVSGIIAAISCILIRPLLTLMNTPEEIFGQTMSYIVVILAGMPITALYNMESSLMRALGNSRTPLLFLAVASVMNVILDIFFVAVLDWGVMGIALATMLAQLTSVILCFFYIRRYYPELHFTREHAKPSKALYGEMLTTGASMAMMSSIFAIGSVCVQGAINSLGTVVITAHTAARKIYENFIMVQASLARGMTTMVSQNYGAGKISRCRKVLWTEIVYALIWDFVLIVIALTLGSTLVGLLGNSTDPEVLRMGRMYLVCQTLGFPVLEILRSMRSYLQAVGRKVLPLFSSTIELIGKIIFTFAIIPSLGYLGVCLTEPILWLACAIYLFLAYLYVNKRMKDGVQTI